jgi:hypothetical protein
MNEVSPEQSVIIENIKKGRNVVVDACAGSGKSTTILSCALQNPEKRFLQITYNSMLRMEIKDKVKVLGLKNIAVHTYHSLAVAKYSKNAMTDSGIRQIFHQNMKPFSPIKPHDVIVLDETQDMTYLYYQLVERFCKDMGTPFQLLILGDYMQGLYEFKGADIRFLTKAEEIWRNYPLLKSNVFVKCSLKTSYRITNQMADFVNHVMLGENRLEACKEGDPVLYIRNKKFFLQKTVVYHILEMKKAGVKPDEIFVLGASVKGVNSQIRRIENVLVEAGIPCHVPMLETDKIDEKVIEGKVVFSTFHCVKGRQRPYVFVVGFDQSYFNIYARTLAKDICPNTLYVACTRATKRLFLLERGEETATDQPLKFLKMNHHEMKQQTFMEFKGQARTVFYDKPENVDDAEIITHHVTPTDLIKFIPESVLEEISPILDSIFVRETEDTEIFDIPTMIKTKHGYYEDVSDLNGIAIPAMYYDYIQSEWETNDNNTNVLYEIIQMTMGNTKQNEYLYLKSIIKEVSPEVESVSDYLYLANLFVASQEKLYYKLKQIERDEYVWLNPSILSKCKERLLNVLGDECNKSKPLIEESIIQCLDEEAHIPIDACLDPHFGNERFRFSARIDLATEETVWELKCTSTISQDHLLQIVIYAWLWRTMDSSLRKEFRIFNIKTGEILRLNATIDVLNQIVIALLKGKYENYTPQPDEEFLKDCRKVFLVGEPVL